MNIENFLATPGSPCISLRVGPNVGDVVNIDQWYFDTHRDEFFQYCLDLPEVEARNWRGMKQFTSNNGLMAKTLIMLGDLVGAWTAHPQPTSAPGLWTNQNPRILAVNSPPKTLVVKPSAGAMELVADCGCCRRPMGELDSLVHDLVRSEHDSRICFECEVMDCDVEDHLCRVFDQPPPRQRRSSPELVPEEEPRWGAPDGIDSYLKGFG
jgi:hypothetical protein